MRPALRAWGSGIGVLETALHIDPENPGLHLRAANVCRYLGNLPNAQEHAQQAIEIFTHITQVAPEQDYTPLAAHLLSADIARGMLQFDQAVSILDLCREESLLSNPTDRLEFHCLSAELALEHSNLTSAMQHITQAVELSADNPGLLALQARIGLRKGELPNSGELDSRSPARDIFQLAMERYHKEVLAQVSSPDGERGVEVIHLLPTMLRRLASAALELRLWTPAIQFFQQYVDATLEPYAQLAFAKCMVLQAEYQRDCHALQVVTHAPGEAALSEEAFRQFLYAIQNAEGIILEWEDNLPADCSEAQWQRRPFCLIKQWHSRGIAVLCPNTHTAEAMLALPTTPENAIAQIAYLSSIGDLPKCGKAASLYPRNPFVLAQLALSLAKALPKQALAAAHAAVEILSALDHEDKDGLFSSEAVSRKNDIPLVYALLAQLVHQSGNDQEDRTFALQALQKALNIWPDEPRWHILAADIYQGQVELPEPERSDQVIRHLEEAIHHAPDFIPAYQYLGQVLLHRGSIQPAIDILGTAIKMVPQNVPIMTLLAQAHMAAGEPQEAEDWADKAMSLAPQDIQPILLRGQLSLDSMNPIAAQGCAQQALEIEPKNPMALLLMARVLRALNQPAQAIDMLESALPNLDFTLLLHLEYIQLIQQTRGSKSALQAASELAERLPNDPQVLSQLARCLADDGQMEEAIGTAQRALRCNTCTEPLSDSDLALLHYQLGSLLCQAGQLDQSIHHLVEAIHANPNFIEPYLELGRVHQQRRQHAQALSAFSQAIAAAPNDARPYYQAGMALKENKDYLEAERMLRRACELAPEDVSIHRLLGAVVTLNLVHNQQPGISRNLSERNESIQTMMLEIDQSQGPG